MNKNFDSQEEKKISKFLVDNFGSEVFTPGLDRTRILFDPLTKLITEKVIKVITISGTNGKGQTAHCLAHLLNQKQLSFALWSSPHILSIRERFNFGNKGINLEIEYEELTQCIFESKKIIDNNYPALQISYYEFLFYVFLKLALAKKRKVEYLILEVGLGGRLDAVNHINADIVALTSISRDHQLILGNRYDLILNEKIGVCRKNTILISNIYLDYLKDKLRTFCFKKNINWINLIPQKDYFENNQALSVAIFKHFYPKSNDKFTFPALKGRQEVIDFLGNSIIFVGAHNIDGVRCMLRANFLNKFSSGSTLKVMLSFSKRPYEELNIMLKLLLGITDLKYKILLTSFEHEKAVDKKIIKLLHSENFKFNEGMLDFVENWKKDLLQSNNEKILVCGSYYFIGEVQRFINSCF
jgi:dihydrofolate synthase/folylpolyglutamate synthase